MLPVRNMAIKHKLIAIVMLTCIVALMLVGSAFLFWEWRSLRGNMLENLSTQAGITSENCKAALTFEDQEDTQETLKALKANSSIVYACVYKKDGEVFASYAQNEPDKTALMPQCISRR